MPKDPEKMLRSLTFLFIGLLLSLDLLAQDSQRITEKASHEFEFEIESEYRYFYKDAQFEDQKNHYPSLAIRPEYSIEWKNGYESINFKGFFRWDRDNERTHWDIRELYYQKAKNNWELSIGLKKIFWGVVESNHLVDVINQTDAVETFDGEEKLGQPMVQYSLITNNWGTFDFFYLPFHRQRTFPGREGRLRFGTVVDQDDLGYESNANEWRQDFAFRWKHYIGAFDIGLSHFYGNGREPLFVFKPTGEINAFYPVIHQTGVDVQITHNAFLWKLESIYRDADAQSFFAMAAGLEYTFGNIDGNGLDIGVLGEYLFDERDELALTALQNDIFLGSRVAFNDVQDTSILIGGILDLESSSSIFSLEASRRFGSTWTVEIEGRIFSDIDEEELILSNFRDDGFLRITISRFF
ncbi:MAG: hypothetical protein AAF039_14665 [Bacteroidota bacterium]